LTEVLLAGAIPVILSNGWVLPFSEFLDWDSFSVRLDEKMFMANPSKAIAALLKDVDPSCTLEMRRRARHVAVAHFSSVGSVAQGLATVLAGRALGCSHCVGIARSDVAVGSAEVCLPKHLRGSALKNDVLNFESNFEFNSRSRSRSDKATVLPGQQKLPLHSNLNWVFTSSVVYGPLGFAFFGFVLVLLIIILGFFR
jgi:hypothetical protein